MTTSPRSIPEDRGSLTERFSAAAGYGLLTNVLAIAAISTLLAGVHVLALIFGSLSFGLSVGFRLRTLPPATYSVRPTGSFTMSRTILAISLGVVSPGGAESWLAVGLLASLIAGEASIARIARGAIPFASGVPGLTIRNHGYFGAGWIFYINSATLLLIGTVALTGVPAWIALTFAVLAAVPSAVTIIDGIRRVRARRIAERTITAFLDSFQPSFVVHWDAPPGTEYQLSMWLPYLARLNKKFFVVVRNQDTFATVATLTKEPVLLRKSLADMDAMVVPSLKAAFYMNNGIRNAHFVRFSQLTHIQLNHGDSDKAPSYNPVFRMFDKNFVAGQAAIDRFANNGIAVPPDFFSIVGRPQVEDIRVGPRTDRRPDETVVLYAPTWAGHNADSNYTSLPVGYDIIRALLDRGCTIIYRSHPYTTKNKSNATQSAQIVELLRQDVAASGRQHLWGDKSEKELSMTDCFNASDALVSDVSSVVPDFLFSEKPFAMAAMTATAHTFANEFPLAEAAYVIDRDLSNLNSSLNLLLEDDPSLNTRRKLKSYYLGDFPPESYANAFLTEAAKYL